MPEKPSDLFQYSDMLNTLNEPETQEKVRLSKKDANDPYERVSLQHELISLLRSFVLVLTISSFILIISLLISYVFPQYFGLIIVGSVAVIAIIAYIKPKIT